MSRPPFMADSEVTSLYAGIFECPKYSKPSSNVCVTQFHQASLQGMHLFRLVMGSLWNSAISVTTMLMACL